MLGYYAIYSGAISDRIRAQQPRRSFFGLLPHEIGALSRRRAGRNA